MANNSTSQFLRKGHNITSENDVCFFVNLTDHKTIKYIYLSTDVWLIDVWWLHNAAIIIRALLYIHTADQRANNCCCC